MMNLAVIKYTDRAAGFLRGFMSPLNLVCICDPDIIGIHRAQADMKEGGAVTEYFSDYSLAIRAKDVDTVLLTLPDRLNELALIATAYGKRVLNLSGVPFDERVFKVMSK